MNTRAVRYHFDHNSVLCTEDYEKYGKRTRYTSVGALLVKGYLDNHLAFTLNEDGKVQNVQRFTLCTSTIEQLRAGFPLYWLHLESATNEDKQQLQTLIDRIVTTEDFWNI